MIFSLLVTGLLEMALQTYFALKIIGRPIQ